MTPRTVLVALIVALALSPAAQARSLKADNVSPFTCRVVSLPASELQGR
jgi:hypothetical protein